MKRKSTSMILKYSLVTAVFVATLDCTFSQVVQSCTLVNADGDTDVGVLSDGDTVVKPSFNINVRANTSGSIGSVVFELNGGKVQTENAAPYALAGDTGGNYLPWKYSVGSQTIRATPYSKESGGGTAGTPREITFMLSESGPLPTTAVPVPTNPAPVPTIDQPTSQPAVGGVLRQWHRVDITFSGPSTSESASSNPFLEYRLQVTFNQGEKSFNVPGYYASDGKGGSSGNKWRVHFSPPTTGTWSYEASFHRGTNINVSTNANDGVPTSFDGDKGSFNVVASNKSDRDFRSSDKGLIKNRGNFYLTFALGTPWVKGGPNIPENFLAHPFTAHGGQIGALDFISSKGCNSIYFLLNNIGGDGDDTWPYIEKYTRADFAVRFNTSKLDGWEQIFLHAESKGILLHVVLAEAEVDNENYHDDGTLGVERKLFYRHLIARFGHHNGIEFNIGEENNYGTRKRKQFAAEIKKNDPYDHPVTTHTKRSAYDSYNELLGDGNFDITSFQGTTSNMKLAELINHLRNDSRNAGVPWTVSFDEPYAVKNIMDEATGFPHVVVTLCGPYTWPVAAALNGTFWMATAASAMIRLLTTTTR